MDLISLLIVLLMLILPLYIFADKIFLPREFVRKLDKLPGEKSQPIFGNALQQAALSNSDLVRYDYSRFKKYGPVSRSWFLNTGIVHIYSAEACEILLGGMKHIEKSLAYEFLQDWLGEGLLTSKGQKWHSHRKIITPTFHFKILESFMEIMVDKANILVKVLEKKIDNKKQFNVFPLITNATLDIICETAMGTNIHAQESVNNDYIAAIYSVSELLVYRLRRPWLRPNIFYKWTEMGKQYSEALNRLHNFTDRIIREKKEERKFKAKHTTVEQTLDEDFGQKKRVAFLDLLLDVADKDSSLTDLDIRDEVDTFMFEGHDTTTAGLAWTIYLLGRHPEIQEQAYAELKEIYNGEDRPITFQDINEMKYLERVIKESLRLYPPVPGFARKIEEDFTVEGYTIPAGAIATMHPFSMHRNPKHFPNPETFNPDNFLPEVAKKRHPYAYLPFSAGPRNCIGQKFAMIEEKTVLASIIRNFKITSVEKPEDITLVSELILRPQGGMNIILERR